MDKCGQERTKERTNERKNERTDQRKKERKYSPCLKILFKFIQKQHIYFSEILAGAAEQVNYGEP